MVVSGHGRRGAFLKYTDIKKEATTETPLETADT